MSPEVSNSRPPSALETASSEDERRAAQECDRIRHRITSQLESAVNADGIVLTKTVMNLELESIKEEKMHQYGAKTVEKQYEWLIKNENEMLPKMLRQARQFSQKLQDAVTHAKNKGGLTEKNIEHLKAALSRHDGSWLKVEAFFRPDSEEEDSLNVWVKKWNAVAEKNLKIEEKINTLKNRPGFQMEDIPSLAALKTKEFTDGKVLTRLKMLEDALQALTKYEHGHSILYKKAEGELRKSVQGKTLPEAEIQKQLHRIFQKYKGQALEDYVLKTLPKRAQEREPEMKEFVKLAAKAKKNGQAVLEEDEFFEKSYNERRAELTRLQKNTSPEAQKTHPLLQAAQEQINLDNFDGAENMIMKAKQQDLSETDKKFIFDLQQQISCERESTSPKKNSDQEATIDLQKKRKDVQDELHKMHPEMREYYAWALRKGGMRMWARMRRLRVWTYNIKWAHDHGHIPDHKRLMDIREHSKKDTERINKEGHRETGVEMIDTEKAGGVEGADREFGGKSRGATYFKYHKKNMDKMEKIVDAELTDERKNYWGLAVPGSDDVRLEEIIRVHNDFHPKLKALEAAQKKAGKEYEALEVNDIDSDSMDSLPLQSPGVKQAA